MATNYISTHGMIWGEISDSGVTTSYGHDALGSVTETYAAGAVQNTYRYKPYGGLLAKSGSAADPRYLWNGGNGYRATNLANAAYYVQSRHYSVNAAGWTTQDANWPFESPYAYGRGRPTTFVDASGKISTGGGLGASPVKLQCWAFAPGRSVINQNMANDAIAYDKNQNIYGIRVFDQCSFTCLVGYFPPISGSPPGGIYQWIVKEEVVYGDGSKAAETLPRQDSPDPTLKTPCATYHGGPNPADWGQVDFGYGPLDWWFFNGLDAPGLLGEVQPTYPNDCTDISGYLKFHQISQAQLPTASQHITKKTTFHTCCVCDYSSVTNDPKSGGSACIDWSISVDIDPSGVSTWGAT